MSDRITDIKYDWRLRLEMYCNRVNAEKPTYSTFSDRRGGRTAWSCTVTVRGTPFPARYWFDGPYIENAMEDAAEVALKILDPKACQPPSQGRPSGTID
ncbi:hypothetical protein BJX61DRAFT_81649 [Aspergillus egyptiacus]|nr:hypothetical protein BJX61DRAFT_81649 [Aspergillus egyptiacus]